MYPWLKDYHIYYSSGLAQSFEAFTQAHGFEQHYPEVFVYEMDGDNSWALYTNMSSTYAIESSRFYTPENEAMIKACFYFMIERVKHMIAASGKRFEDVIFSSNIDLRWRPFNRALFYHQPNHHMDNPVVISSRESYQLIDGKLRKDSTYVSTFGGRFIGYLFKEMEFALRRLTGFPYAIRARLPGYQSELKKLAEMGIKFPEFVHTAVKDFYDQHTHEPVHVELSDVGKIREEALETQERLIVPEEAVVSVLPMKVSSTIEPSQTSDETTLANTPSITTDTNPWQQLHTALTDMEREALTIVCTGQSLAHFARDKFIMLEVLVDGINEKAMDIVGDSLLAIDETVTIYDDYRLDVEQWLT